MNISAMELEDIIQKLLKTYKWGNKTYHSIFFLRIFFKTVLLHNKYTITLLLFWQIH